MNFSVPGPESERLLFIQPNIPSELRRLCSGPWDEEGRARVSVPWSASVDIVADCGNPRLKAAGGSSMWIGGLEGYSSVGAVIIWDAGLRGAPPVVLVLGITGDGAPSSKSSSKSFKTGEPWSWRALELERLKNGGRKLRRRRCSCLASTLGPGWVGSRFRASISRVLISRVGIPVISSSLEPEARLLSSSNAGLMTVPGDRSVGWISWRVSRGLGLRDRGCFAAATQS